MLSNALAQSRARKMPEPFLDARMFSITRRITKSASRVPTFDLNPNCDCHTRFSAPADFRRCSNIDAKTVWPLWLPFVGFTTFMHSCACIYIYFTCLDLPCMSLDLLYFVCVFFLLKKAFRGSCTESRALHTCGGLGTSTGHANRRPTTTKETYECVSLVS